MDSSVKTVSAKDDGVVNSHCQKCSRPLKLESGSNLDSSFCVLGVEDNNDDGNGFLKIYEATNSYCDISRKVILPFILTETVNNFTVVDEMFSLPQESFNYNALQLVNTFFDLLSDQFDINHHLCEKCTDKLLSRMDQQLMMAESECKEYREFFHHLHPSEDDDNDMKKLQEVLAKLKEEEASLQAELHESEEKVKNIKEIKKVYEKEHIKLQKEKDEYLWKYNNLKKQISLYLDDLQSVTNQLDYGVARLSQLKRKNVFSITFRISRSGHFGTINCLRLGMLPKKPVHWTEINSAWGQTVLMLHSLAKKMNLTFKRYKLVPYGSRSYLVDLVNNSRDLPLHCSGGYKILYCTEFDQAMVAFLDCLQQFKEEVEKNNSGFQLPYEIDKGKIKDTFSGLTCSIRLQFNCEEHWTIALRFMLFSLQLLAMAS